MRRIIGFAPRSFITAPPIVASRRSGSGPVARSVRESTRYLREVQPRMGQIRLRAPIDQNGPSDWRVDLFEPARPLSALVGPQ